MDSHSSYFLSCRQYKACSLTVSHNTEEEESIDLVAMAKNATLNACPQDFIETDSSVRMDELLCPPGGFLAEILFHPKLSLTKRSMLCAICNSGGVNSTDPVVRVASCKKSTYESGKTESLKSFNVITYFTHYY